MAFELTTYQDEAARELLQDAERLLRQGGNKKLVFRAPTGSGKTITVAEFLRRFADSHNHQPCAFIWAAPRQLHEQSKEKLEQYFDANRSIECSFFEDLNDRRIGENEVLFFNWESIRQENNICIRENEQENNLSNIIERTREEDRAIVLIIDESHFHAQAETSQNLIAAIAPDLTIEVSATPIMQNPDRIVPVEIGDVKAEEMIKKAVILNENFKSLIAKGKTQTIKNELAGSTDEIVLTEALKKREELSRAYNKLEVSVNPLLLIQLPDRHGQADDDRQNAIVQFLKTKGITTANGKLAFYLSENKENLENLTKNENETEVLIFKQAIALGWDCPRAQILVLFREWHSPIFSIQTIGRIMRVPEPDHGYYSDDRLNYAYVYTNIDDIQVKEDIGNDYLLIHTSRLAPKLKGVALPSVHSKRHREQTRLTPLFTKLFLEVANEYGLTKKIKTKGQHVQPAFISDWSAEDVDVIVGEHIHANVHIETASDTDLQRLFDYFVRKNLSPFHPEDRSVGRLKESIYQFFDKQLKMNRLNRFRDIINIVLSEDNREHFAAIIDTAKRNYITETERRERELVEEEWNLPDHVSFGDGYVEMKAKKSAMQPFFSNERWQSEKAFIEFLDNPRNKVLWWFKNGDRDATFFAIPYKLGNGFAPFYIDFVVMMKDGSIGLFDPHGIHLADFAVKSDGLRAYIARLKKSGRKVFGGIVANTEPRHFSGQWLVYEGEGNNNQDKQWSGWVPLII